FVAPDSSGAESEAGPGRAPLRGWAARDVLPEQPEEVVEDRRDRAQWRVRVKEPGDPAEEIAEQVARARRSRDVQDDLIEVDVQSEQGQIEGSERQVEDVARATKRERQRDRLTGGVGGASREVRERSRQRPDRDELAVLDGNPGEIERPREGRDIGDRSRDRRAQPGSRGLGGARGRRNEKDRAEHCCGDEHAESGHGGLLARNGTHGTHWVMPPTAPWGRWVLALDGLASLNLWATSMTRGGLRSGETFTVRRLQRTCGRPRRNSL